VVGVSSDEPQTAERFRESLDLPFPLVGDPKGRILEAWGVRVPLVGMARRVTFVVGRDGRIESRHESNFSPESHVAQACRFVRGPRAS
jgi:peroxiredoxin